MDNEEKPKSKAEQFLTDVGLHFDLAKLQEATIKPKKGVLLPFQSNLSLRMDKPENALEIHIQNLITTYGLAMVTNAINKEETIQDLEDDPKLWGF